MQTSEYEQIVYQHIPSMKIFLTHIIYPTTHHFHEELELLLVLEGSLHVTSGSEIYQAKPGDFLLFSSYEPHYLESLNQQGLVLVIQMHPRFCASYFPDLHSLMFKLCVFPSEKYEEIFHLSLKLSRTYWLEETGYELACMGYLNLLLAALLQNIPSHRIDRLTENSRSEKIRRLNHILEYIKSHYTEKLLLTQVAEYENLSLHYLSHFFKEQMGISFQDYLKQLRFEKAVELVEQTSHNILDICVACGFSDSRYFYKMFHSYFHCTPSEYRKNCRNFQAASYPLPKGNQNSPSQIISGRKKQLSLLENCLFKLSHLTV